MMKFQTKLLTFPPTHTANKARAKCTKLSPNLAV